MTSVILVETPIVDSIMYTSVLFPNPHIFSVEFYVSIGYSTGNGFYLEKDFLKLMISIIENFRIIKRKPVLHQQRFNIFINTLAAYISPLYFIQICYTIRLAPKLRCTSEFISKRCVLWGNERSLDCYFLWIHIHYSFSMKK
jgi:hypothetical protein